MKSWLPVCKSNHAPCFYPGRSATVQPEVNAMTEPANNLVVCTFYKFTPLDQYTSLQQPILDQLSGNRITGTLLLAREGINGTIAGERQAVDEFLSWLAGQAGFSDIEYKQSETDRMPFKRTRVKLKKEIVTMGVEDIDPAIMAGTYIAPEDWNALLEDPQMLVVDTRNEYEIEVGHFANAVNPHTTNFREFPQYALENLDPEKHKKIAMYCTGGIRCEKATAFLKQNGFESVYHLKGGILNYLKTVPAPESRWQGECFVFDERVTVDHDLNRGSYDQCHGCRMPITEQDKASEYYQPGVSCPKCHGQRSQQDKARFAEREKQVQLAEERGRKHLGPEAMDDLIA